MLLFSVSGIYTAHKFISAINTSNQTAVEQVLNSIPAKVDNSGFEDPRDCSDLTPAVILAPKQPVSKEIKTILEPLKKSPISSIVESNTLLNDQFIESKTTPLTSDKTSKVHSGSVPLASNSNQTVAPMLATKQASLLPNPSSNGLSLNGQSSPSFEERAKLYFGVFAGLNTWQERAVSNQNGGAYTSILDGAIRSKMGATTSLIVQLPISRSFHITTGLAYQYTLNIFEFSQNWDTVMYRNNIPGSDLVNAVALREVQQHNELHLLSIPILIGLKKEYKTLAIGLDTGLGLNFRIDQNGKSLDHSEFIFPYDSQSSSAPYSDFHFSYHVQPYINYGLNANLDLQLRGDFSHHTLGFIEVYQHKRQAFLSTFSLGLVWSRDKIKR